ncbi:hypothetical protein FIBSPDRAFT_262147 [Athelia psychrophila]|uniref:Uncharacterized protein n=1 Tax=Athelia psychrophila TaxID=1759441 RepID=A0A165XFM1_9AGAM|nr:hypothetical protein FIBSPDRAFT_262147 [Fibularhizoctonia sp. CBS 109695]
MTFLVLSCPVSSYHALCIFFLLGSLPMLRHLLVPHAFNHLRHLSVLENLCHLTLALLDISADYSNVAAPIFVNTYVSLRQARFWILDRYTRRFAISSLLDAILSIQGIPEEDPQHRLRAPGSGRLLAGRAALHLHHRRADTALKPKSGAHAAMPSTAHRMFVLPPLSAGPREDDGAALPPSKSISAPRGGAIFSNLGQD